MVWFLLLTITMVAGIVAVLFLGAHFVILATVAPSLVISEPRAWLAWIEVGYSITMSVLMVTVLLKFLRYGKLQKRQR